MTSVRTARALPSVIPVGADDRTAGHLGVRREEPSSTGDLATYSAWPAERKDICESP